MSGLLIELQSLKMKNNRFLILSLIFSLFLVKSGFSQTKFEKELDLIINSSLNEAKGEFIKEEGDNKIYSSNLILDGFLTSIKQRPDKRYVFYAMADSDWKMIDLNMAMLEMSGMKGCTKVDSNTDKSLLTGMPKGIIRVTRYIKNKTTSYIQIGRTDAGAIFIIRLFEQ